MVDDAHGRPTVPDGRGQLSKRVAHTLSASRESWTRRMFELATQLRSDDAAPVYDLSLGNPSLEPPPVWRRAVLELLADEPPGMHRYMTNAGFAEVRAFVAAHEAKRYGVPFEPADVTMSVGAAGALNVLAHAMLDVGDEVLVPAPYFSEYEHYCATVGARLVVAQPGPSFTLDLAAIDRAIGPRTRWLLLNSPNNPTGVVYDAEQLDALAQLLVRANGGRGRAITVIEDAPYRDLVYDGSDVPSMLTRYADTILVTSQSKGLGLAGERIGYLLISPRSSDRGALSRAAGYCTRVLGFVNAPALMQRVLPRVLADPEGRVDVSVYARNCGRMAAALTELGFTLPPPRAGFFLFPELPERHRAEGGGDIELTERLVGERTIVVPGTAFGSPGFLRMSLAVEGDVVEGAIAALRRICG